MEGTWAGMGMGLPVCGDWENSWGFVLLNED